jgi:nitroreductase
VPLDERPERTPEEMLRRAEEFRSHVSRRRTVRHFSALPVPREVIEECLRAAGSAPSGANLQPWHFVAVSDPEVKARIREAAEDEEREFYAHRAPPEWLAALEPLGTDPDKPFLETAPRLIVCFAQRTGGIEEDGKAQNYYVTESGGIACGLLLATLHEAGRATLTHTPSPMGFLRRICGRPTNEKPLMIVVAGHPAPDASVPAHALRKKPLGRIASWF